MPLGVTLRLHDSSGSLLSNQSGITALWWDQEEVFDLVSPIGKTQAATTDSSGDLILDLSDVSGLASGGYGFLALYKPDGSDHKDSPVFLGKVQTSSVSGGVKLSSNPEWVRNTLWAALSSTAADNTFSGLHAVYPNGPNWCAFKFSVSSSGQYTVDWGDSTSNEDINSNTTAQHSYAYANCPDNDVGKANEVSCDFTDSGDTVDIPGHDFVNGTLVSFSEINSTTGISVGSLYYVVNATTNDFQVADTIGGAAKTLTTDGTGKVYRPIYRTVVVDVVPKTGGSNLTEINLDVRHSSASAVIMNTGWLDLALHAESLTTISRNLSAVRCHSVERVNFNLPALTSVSNLFNNWYSLAYVEKLVLGAITSAAYLFNYCASLRSVPVLNTASATTFAYMFDSCYALRSIPLLDTSSGTAFNHMFYYCGSLKTIPLLDTADGTTFNSMFAYCGSLEEVPQLDTGVGQNFSNMFLNCTSMKRAPELNVGAGTNFSGMFELCVSLDFVPKLDTHSGVNFSGMFGNCSSLSRVPLLDTSSGTDFSKMFYYCMSLKEVPLLDVGAGTTFSAMFTYCYSLQVGALKGTAQNITYPAGQLSGSELDRIYGQLAAVSSKTITVTGNYGAAADDPSIATAKGWTVTS